MSRPYPFPVERGSAWLSSEDITSLVDINSLLDVPTDWTAFTPTGSWTNNTTYTGQYKMIGDLMLARIKIALAGAPNSTVLTVNIPSGYTFDASNVAEDQFSVKGYGIIYDAAPRSFPCSVVVEDTNTVRVLAHGANETYTFCNSVTQAIPITFASGDWVSIQFSARVTSA